MVGNVKLNYVKNLAMFVQRVDIGFYLIDLWINTMTKAEVIKLLQDSPARDDIEVIVSTSHDIHFITGIKDLGDGVLYLSTDS